MRVGGRGSGNNASLAVGCILDEIRTLAGTSRPLRRGCSGMRCYFLPGILPKICPPAVSRSSPLWRRHPGQAAIGTKRPSSRGRRLPVHIRPAVGPFGGRDLPIMVTVARRRSRASRRNAFRYLPQARRHDNGKLANHFRQHYRRPYHLTGRRRSACRTESVSEIPTWLGNVLGDVIVVARRLPRGEPA